MVSNKSFPQLLSNSRQASLLSITKSRFCFKQITQRETDRLGEMQAANRRIQDDLARVSRERDDILRELQYFKRQLNEKNNNTSDIEDQLNRSRQVSPAKIASSTP